MDDSYRPIGQASPSYEDRGPTHPSTCGDRPTQKSAPPPPGIRKIIGELGLRYRPNDRADLEAHAARLALLAADLADVPARYLELAAKDWARRNPYLPKANELASLAKIFAQGVGTPQPKGSEVEKRRRMLPRMNETRSRDDIEWCLSASGDFVIRDI